MLIVFVLNGGDQRSALIKSRREMRAALRSRELRRREGHEQERWEKREEMQGYEKSRPKIRRWWEMSGEWERGARVSARRARALGTEMRALEQDDGTVRVERHTSVASFFLQTGATSPSC